ncbi:MAG: hypothetical protein ACRDUV_27215 [Pseudonocardiaceae bacterium]
MPDRVLVLLNDDLADPDASLLRGAGVFETVLVIDGVALELGAHLARLARSAARCSKARHPRWSSRRLVTRVHTLNGPPLPDTGRAAGVVAVTHRHWLGDRYRRCLGHHGAVSVTGTREGRWSKVERL